MNGVETKVQAGSLSAGVAGVALWALQTYVFKGGTVPDGLVSLVYLLVPAVVAGVAGYLAPHASRPGELTAVSPAVAAEIERRVKAATTPPPGPVTMTSVGPVGPVDPATGRAP